MDRVNWEERAFLLTEELGRNKRQPVTPALPSSFLGHDEARVTRHKETEPPAEANQG